MDYSVFGCDHIQLLVSIIETNETTERRWTCGCGRSYLRANPPYSGFAPGSAHSMSCRTELRSVEDTVTGVTHRCYVTIGYDSHLPHLKRHQVFPFAVSWVIKLRRSHDLLIDFCSTFVLGPKSLQRRTMQTLQSSAKVISRGREPPCFIGAVAAIRAQK